MFIYDFGYGFMWNYGHLLAIVSFGALTVLAWRLQWSRWLCGLAFLGALWGVVGLLIVQLVMRMNLPLQLPTENFLADAAGPVQVLDAGGGSGRSSLMVLQARPRARVMALDLYDGYFGISDNSPDRLFANASAAGVRDRIDAVVGDVREMALEEASMDAAVSAYVIDHLRRDDAKQALSEVQRVLRPGGQFLLLVINPDAWVRVAYPFFVHHGYFGGRTDHERWRDSLIEAGFEVAEYGTSPGTLYLLATVPEEGAKGLPVSQARRR